MEAEKSIHEFLQSVNAKKFLDEYKKVSESTHSESEILLDFVVAFLAQIKNGVTKKLKDKYVYLVPETFLCWALFEYSYYNCKKGKNKETVLQFVKKTLEAHKSGLVGVLEKYDNNANNSIWVHYEAYKFLAGNAREDICNGLKLLSSGVTITKTNKSSL